MSTDAISSRQISILLPCVSAGFLIFFLLQPTILMVAGALILAGLLALVLRWPETGTLVVLFALYSNVSVLAMRSPSAIAASAGSADKNPRILVVLAALSLLLAVSLIYQIFVRKERLIFDRGLVLMLIFLAVSLASSFFARDGQIVESYVADYLLEGLVLYFLLTNVIRDFSILRRATWVLLLAGSLMASLSIFQTVTHTEKNIYGGLAQVDYGPKEAPETKARLRAAGKISSGGEVAGQVRLGGPIGGANEYAQILLVLLPLTAVQFRMEPSRKWRGLAVVAAALILGGLILTYSRSALLTIVIVFGMMACMGLIKPRHVLVSVLGVGLLVTVLAPTVVTRMLTLERLNSLFSRTHASGQAPDSSAVFRYVLDVAAWHVFLDHPILGVGPGQFAKHYSSDYVNRVGAIEQRKNYLAHNLYLETLAERGLIGTACFLSIPVAIMYGLWKERTRLKRSHPELAFAASGFSLSLAGFAISSIFEHLAYQRYFWLLLALSSAAIRILRCCSEKQATEESFLR
jgi:putative inorganic carbon (HCO3(-)) transporter